MRYRQKGSSLLFSQTIFSQTSDDQFFGSLFCSSVGFLDLAASSTRVLVGGHNNRLIKSINDVTPILANQTAVSREILT